MKLFVLCIFIAGLAATQAKKNYVCIELYTEPKTPPTSPPVEPVPCDKCQADAIALSLTQYCYIPVCNEDNTFRDYQYDTVKNESFCFNLYGAEIEGSRVQGPGADCTVVPVTTKEAKLNPCAAKKAMLGLSGNPLGIALNCDANGFYTNVQCVKVGPKAEQEYCLCTQPNGNMIPGTVKAKGAEDRTAECARHVDIKPECKLIKPEYKLIPYPGAVIPDDCGRYVTCAPERTYTCICGDGQYFDYVNQKCDWAENVQCPGITPIYGY